ncbi:MAG: NIPSNAP family protein [Bryobacterales bacterium]|nr:NIPSNAP family protein [Bryobacterales bacterium]
MDRRTFLTAMRGLTAMGGTALLAGAATTHKTRYYQLDQYLLKNGSQTGRIHAFLKGSMEFFSGPRIILDGLIAPHMPQVVVIQGHSSIAEYFEAEAKRKENAAYRAALTAWEAGDEAPYETFSTSLLEATPYSPDISGSSKSPRIFELRTYHSPTTRQLAALHERFSGPEIRIFHRVGVHPILYTSTIIGANRPNLTYLIPFDSLEARDKAWTAFGADPEWIKVRKESIDRSGQISSVIQIALYKATDYSPIR